MRMPSKKNDSTNAALLAAVLALAACDRHDKPRIDTAPLSVMQVAAADDIDTHLQTVVEQRHFAIYNSYRVLFDESADAIRSDVGATDGDDFACSLKTALLRD